MGWQYCVGVYQPSTWISHRSTYMHVCLVAQSSPTHCDPLDWTVAQQASLSIRFFRQEHWSGPLFPLPEDLPDPGIKPVSPVLQADSLPAEPSGKLNLHVETDSQSWKGPWGSSSLILLSNKWGNWGPVKLRASGSLHKPLILIHQRADRMKTIITENESRWLHGSQLCVT